MYAFRCAILVFAGLFSIGGALFEWSFFMQSRRAQLMVSILGYGATRAFYIGLGAILVVLGVVLLFV